MGHKTAHEEPSLPQTSEISSISYGHGVHFLLVPKISLRLGGYRWAIVLPTGLVADLAISNADIAPDKYIRWGLLELDPVYVAAFLADYIIIQTCSQEAPSWTIDYWQQSWSYKSRWSVYGQISRAIDSR